jgi:acyl-CoA synthetase (AMP-forming)/AMP-acid ligase II
MRGELTIGDIFRNAARAVPDRTAAALGDATLSFAHLDRVANRVARALDRLGVGPGQPVVVWSATTLDLVPLFAALAKSGAVFAPMGAALSVAEATAVAASAGPGLLVVDADHADKGEAVAAAVGVALAALGGLAGGEPPATGPGVSLATRAAALDDTDVTTPELREDDPHVVFFTSGTTGIPKGAILSHRVNVLRSHPGALLEQRGPMVCPYPLSHMGAWTIALQQWQARDRVVFLPSADAPAITAAVARHGATRLNAIPAVWSRILASGAREGAVPALASLRFADTGTSATPVELLEDIERAAPRATIRVFYGSTEAGSVASLDHADIRRKPGSCGVPAPGTEVRVADDGELWVRGPLLFDGYLGDAAATAAVLVNGWYRTGDVADVDDEGYLTIVGRVRDVIRTGGETVSPTEVESVLARHPAVRDVAVVGVPDTAWGEIVCAVVVAAPGPAPPSLGDLRAHCAGALAAFKHPRRLEIVEAIPRTSSTRQVQRRLLAERLSS